MMEILHFTAESVAALQEAYLVRLFKDANFYVIHAERINIMPKDINMLDTHVESALSPPEFTT